MNKIECSLSKKILYIICICIFLVISFYITYSVIIHQNAKNFFKKHENILGKFHCSKLPFLIFTEGNCPRRKEFNIIVAQKKETPLCISNTISKNYMSYSLANKKKYIHAYYQHSNNKINSITLNYENVWLEDFNGDDIWDQKKIYSYKHPDYIFLNGKWISFAKNEFGRPRVVSMKSGEKYFFNKSKGIWQKLEKNNSEYQNLKTAYKKLKRKGK